jgi:hypothetical protein
MSSTIIDKKFIGLVSSRLRNLTYKNTASVVASFTHTCERSDSRKKRAHFLSYPDGVFMRCFNCGEALPLSKFLQDVDPVLYREYCLENFKEGIWESKETYRPVLVEPVKVEPKPTINYFESLISYADLPSNHPALQYIVRRQIPESRYKELYLAPKFYKWASRIDPIFLKFAVDVPRLIVPYYDLNKKLLGFSCRAFGKEIPKYIHLRTDKENEFIYGQDHVDINKPLLVVEGQIDSMFLENCVAIGRADYKSGFLETHKQNIVIIPDNDFRRNIHVCNQIRRAITSGFKVCFLPDYWKKDVNDIVKSGITASEIQDYVIRNKKSGASALLELALERKC